MNRILFFALAFVPLFFGCQPKSEENSTKEPMSALDSLQALNPTSSEVSRFIAEVADRILYDSISRIEGDTNSLNSIGTEIGDTNISVLWENAGEGTERVLFYLSTKTSTGMNHLQIINLKSYTVELRLNSSGDSVLVSILGSNKMGGSAYTKINLQIDNSFDAKILDLYGQNSIVGVNDARNASKVTGNGFVGILANGNRIRLWYDDPNDRLRISGLNSSPPKLTTIDFCFPGISHVKWRTEFDVTHVCP